MAVDYSKYHSILDSYEPYQPPAPVDQAAPKQNASALADFGTDLKRGLQQVPSAVTGLLDIPVAAATGRPMVSEGWEGLGQITGFQPQKWSDEARAEYSPERQAAQQQAAQAEGFADTAGVYLSNPSLLAGTVLESVPSIALGGVYGRALRGVGALSGVTRGAIGEGGVMAGQSMNEMVDDGVDPRRAAAFATGVGVAGGALGGLGGSLTQRMGLVDVDTLAAGGARAAGVAAPALLRRVAGGAVAEGVFEELPQTLVETSLGNLAAERSWDEDLGKNAAVGLLAGGLMGGVVNIPGARRQRDMTQEAPAQDAAAPVEPNALDDAIKTDTVPVQNWIDKQLRIGVSPAQTQKDARAAFEGKIEPRLILDENGVPRTTTSAFDVYEFQNDFDARMAKQASRPQGTTATPVEPQAPQQVDEDPAVASLRTSQFAGTIFKKDGAMRQNADKAWKAYNEFADTEIDAAIEELAPQPKAGWRIAMLESIRAARAQEPQAQGAPNVAQVDAARGQGAGAVPAGSAGNAPSGPVVLDGARQPAGAPVPGSAAAIPVGEPVVQQPAGLTEGAQPTNVPPAQQVDAQAEEARGQEGAQSVAAQTGVTPPARPMEDTPEARAAYIGELRGFLNASVAAQPQEVADAMRAVFGGFRQVSDVASALMNARNGLIERHRERFGAEPDAAALRKIDVQLAKLHKQMSENADDPVTSSLRAAARDLGVSHETVRTRMNKGVAALQQAATEAGIDIDAALEMTGVKPSAVLAYMDSISEAEAAQMGLSYRRSGPRTTRNAGDDAFNLDDAGADYFEEGLGGAVDEDAQADAGVQNSTIDAQAATDQADEGVDFDAMASEERGRAERVAERTNTFATERDHNGNPLRDVDFQEAAEDYNESVDTAAGDLSFEQLDRARQVAYTKAYVANMDGVLSAQQLMRVFGDIADATRAKQDTQADDQRAAQEEGAVAQVQGTVQGGREGGAETGRAAREEVTPTNPLEARVAALRELNLGEKQSARLDKLVRRYQNREIDTERLDEELLAIEENADKGMRYSRAPSGQGTTVEAVRSAINDIATPAGNRKITVVQSADELIERGILNSSQARGTQGYVTRKGDAYFIADNIRPGNELAVVLHEIGAHLGIENLLTDKQYETLVKKIFDWAQSSTDSQASRIARAAIRRVAQAKIENEADLSPETIAYFIEEAVKAGVNPTAMQYKTELGRWFRTLWAAFKVALRRLNLINADRLTAQNVVDLAYGAARVQLAGQYHGTAANFRRFDHRFMGSGEGAQAFGWGTYLAQRFGIANEYFEADIGRKSGVLYKGEAIKQSWPRGQEPTDLETALAAVAARFADSYSLRKALQKGTVTASDFKSVIADAQYELASDNDMAAHDALENVRPEDFGVGQAEGNIHITDVNATEDELLDWDKPLSEQSTQVQEALEAVFDNYDIGIAGYDNLDMTGEQVYKRLSGSRGLGSDKAASEYLDSLGVKGIKFLDAMSRGKSASTVSFDGKTYTDEDLRRAYDNRNHPLNDYAITLKQVLRQGVDKTLAELRAKFDRTVENFVNIERESLARFDMPYDAEKVRSDVEYRVKSTLYGREFDWLQKNKDRIEVVKSQPTRNLVIFNDANIFRVGSMRGGPVGKGGRMMFSKTADPQLTELAQESGQRALKAIQAGIRKGWTGLAFSSHLANAAHRAGLTSARALELVQRKKATRAYEIQIEVEKVLSKFADLKGQINGRPASEAVQRFIYDSTFDKKWGFTPDWKQDAVVDPDMESRFKALPADAQAVIKDVFRHGDAIFKEKQALLRKTITGEYEALIKVETDDGKRRKLERQRDKELREAGRLIAEMNGPYAPLRRYGNYVVVAKSQKYRDEEASGPVDAKLKRDEGHYVVEFAETLYEAERLQGVLEGKFGKGMVWAGEKEESTQQFGELPFMAVQRLRKMVDTDLDGDLNTKSKRTLNKLLVDLYISTLHEANARHSEQKRQFVNRADRDTAAKDMMRAFATQGRADSHLVSALQFNSEIVDEMQKLRNEAKNGQGDSKLKTRLRNEILQRHMMDLDFRETPVQDKLMSLNSFWMLLTSPGYYVQNATQVMLMTQPVLAGKFGQNRSMRQIMRGYQDAMRVLKGSSWNEAADLSRFNGTADEKAMLVELQARGTLDFGISAELGYWESRGEISKVFNQVMRKVGMGTRKLEVLNRMSSALAAYRMMYDQTTGTQAKRHAAALDYADSIIKDTHGDYSTANAPRYLRMLPKVMTQFRKFQLIQLSLFAKTLHGAMKGTSVEERRVARAALGYLFMNHALLAGAVGVPASALLGAIYAIAGDDDDPNDWEVDVRRAVGDKEMADLILHGLPSLININMSNKIGAGTMLDPLPFVEYEATRGGYEKAVTAAMGPLIGGLGAQVVDAFGRILKGDVAQGAAQLLPRGFRDAARGFMAAQDGIKLRNGQTALTPEELSFYDSLMMGLGLPTLKTTSRTETQFKSQQYETFFRERVTKLKRQYGEAYEENDREAMLEARQAWAEMQTSRKNLGFKVQPLSDLLKAPREKAKAEAKLENGIRTTEQARGFVKSLQ